MPNLTMIRDVQFGLHADAADLTSVPSTMRRLAPISGAPAPRPRTVGARTRYSIDNRPHAGVVLIDDLSPFTLVQELRGIDRKSVV